MVIETFKLILQGVGAWFLLQAIYSEKDYQFRLAVIIILFYIVFHLK